jgi:hypothetical protein
MNDDDPVWPEEYYEHIAQTMGQAAADWARLPRAERERELSQLHAQFDTPNDRSIWPPELGGDPDLPPLTVPLVEPLPRRVERTRLCGGPSSASPNGIWLLDDAPFTGIAYSLAANGTTTSEQQFRAGRREGFGWERDEAGRLLSDGRWSRDQLHGTRRQWHADGRLVFEADYEFGVEVRRRVSDDPTK